MTPDTRTALETLLKECRTVLGFAQSWQPLTPGDLSDLRRAVDAASALLSTSPGEPEPPLIRVGDVVQLGWFGLRAVPSDAAARVLTGNDGVDAIYRCVWRRAGQTAPAESTGASHVIPDGTYLCACTCGCVDRTIRPGRCMVCRVRESCLNDERVCEACEDGYRLSSDGSIHYDHNDSTWGVCRKVIAAIRMDRERKRARAEYP